MKAKTLKAKLAQVDDNADVLVLGFDKILIHARNCAKKGKQFILVGTKTLGEVKDYI